MQTAAVNRLLWKIVYVRIFYEGAKRTLGGAEAPPITCYLMYYYMLTHFSRVLLAKF